MNLSTLLLIVLQGYESYVQTSYYLSIPYIIPHKKFTVKL